MCIAFYFYYRPLYSFVNIKCYWRLQAINSLIDIIIITIVFDSPLNKTKESFMLQDKPSKLL